MTWCLFATDLDPTERDARNRVLATLARVETPGGCLVAGMLQQALQAPARRPEALSALQATPTLPTRRLISTHGAAECQGDAR